MPTAEKRPELAENELTAALLPTVTHNKYLHEQNVGRNVRTNENKLKLLRIKNSYNSRAKSTVFARYGNFS